jgi:hypothetical protein
VDEAGQSTEALRWPLGYADLCVASHCHGEKHFCHIFNGTNPLEMLLQSFHIDVQFDRLASCQHVWESLLHSPKRLSPWSCWLRELHYTFYSEERSCDATPQIVFSFRARSDESMSYHPWQWWTRNRHPQPHNMLDKSLYLVGRRCYSRGPRCNNF